MNEKLALEKELDIGEGVFTTLQKVLISRKKGDFNAVLNLVG